MLDDFVRGYAVAVAEDAREAGRLDDVRQEQVAFDQALVTSDALRLALTDAGLPTIERRGIVADLLVDRALPETVDLVTLIVRAVRPADVPSTIAETITLFEDAINAGAGVIDADAPAGRAAARERIRGYVERVLRQLSSPQELDEVEDELFRFARILEDNPALRRVLEDVNFATDARIGVLTDLLGSRATPSMLRVSRYVVRAGRLRNLVGTYDMLAELIAEERNRRIAEVRSAVPLTDEETSRLAVALGRLVSREVEVRDIEDTTVIGGMLISIGDLFIDGTVRLRFERLRDEFAQQS